MDMNRKKSVLLFSNLLQSSKNRVREEKEELDELLEFIVEPAEDDGEDGNILSTVPHGVALATLLNKRCCPREKTTDRAQQRELWSSGYVAGT